MRLRRKSLGGQWLCWLFLFVLGLAVYIFTVRAFDLGSAWAIFGAQQMGVLALVGLLFGWLAYECRWDGIVRVKDSGAVEEASEPVRTANDTHSPPPSDPALPSSPSHLAASAPSSATSLSPEEAWREARNMPHGIIPDPVSDGEYLKLIYFAAEEGHLEALAKLSDYARRRGAFVESFFWMKVAVQKGYAQGGMWLKDVVNEWAMSGAPCEYENEYEHFSSLRGAYARAHMCLIAGIDMPNACQCLRQIQKELSGDALLA